MSRQAPVRHRRGQTLLFLLGSGKGVEGVSLGVLFCKRVVEQGLCHSVAGRGSLDVGVSSALHAGPAPQYLFYDTFHNSAAWRDLSLVAIDYYQARRDSVHLLALCRLQTPGIEALQEVYPCGSMVVDSVI